MVPLSRVMPTHVFLGTESAQVLCGELSADGSFQYRDRVAVSDAAAPAGKHVFAAKTAGAPMVEWLTAHPSGAWLYAFVSFWDKRPGQLRTFAVTPEGRLSAAGDGEGVRMRGWQPCHAVWAGELCAVAHYLSGSVEVFRMSDRGGGGAPTPLCHVP